MITTLTYLGLILMIALPVADLAVFRPRRRALPAAGFCCKFERLVYSGLKLSLVVMAVSSFGMILVGQHMHHWMLTLHMSFAPLFAVCVTAIALMWAEQSTFPSAMRFHFGEKVAFWITVLAGFVTIAAAMLMMMSWFGQSAQHVLLKIHRLAALALVISASFHAYRIAAGSPQAAPQSSAA